MPVKIIAISGSLRKESYNTKILKIASIAAQLAGAEVIQVDLKEYNFPLYDQDLNTEIGLPDSVKKFKKLLQASDAILFASPEHNSTYSSALKNAIDWASRSDGNEPSLANFDGKLAAIISASPGALGGLRGLAQLRLLLENIKVMVIPEQLALQVNDAAFENGRLKDNDKQAKLEAIAKKLVTIAGKLKGA